MTTPAPETRPERERIAQMILDSPVSLYVHSPESARRLADYLLAHGVTFQREARKVAVTDDHPAFEEVPNDRGGRQLPTTATVRGDRESGSPPTPSAPPEALRGDEVRRIVQRIEHWRGQTFSDVQMAGQSLNNLLDNVTERLRALLASSRGAEGGKQADGAGTATSTLRRDETLTEQPGCVDTLRHEAAGKNARASSSAQGGSTPLVSPAPTPEAPLACPFCGALAKATENERYNTCARGHYFLSRSFGQEQPAGTCDRTIGYERCGREGGHTGPCQSFSGTAGPVSPSLGRLTANQVREADNASIGEKTQEASPR